MEWILQKAQNFWVWSQGLNLFGQIPFMVLIFLLSLALLFYIFCWRAKITKMIINRLRKWLNGYWDCKQRNLLEPLMLSVFFAGIFIWVFGGELAMMKQDAVRNLILLTAGVVGWYFLYQRTKTADQNKKAAEKSAEATVKNTDISEQGLTTERLTRATEQLANKSSAVRLGGVLGLEQIAKTHKEECKKIARVLVSFVHIRAAKNSKRSKEYLARCNLSNLETVDDFSIYRSQRLDVEAAVNTLASIASELERQGQFRGEVYEEKHHLCDLQNTDLRGLRFVGADLSNFTLAGADMSGAWLAGANLTGAWLHSYYMKEETKLINALLEGTNFNRALLNFVNFQNDNKIRDTNFSDASLRGANFTEVLILETDLSNAKLDNANFTGARLRDVHGLQQQQLDKAFRWRGYKSFNNFVEDNSLNPPPEKEKPTGFWVYKICKLSEVTHARIHVPWCSFCNYGKGINKEEKPRGNRYDWVFCESYDDAVKTLENFRKKYNCNDVGNCVSCESRRDLPTYPSRY